MWIQVGIFCKYHFCCIHHGLIKNLCIRHKSINKSLFFRVCSFIDKDFLSTTEWKSSQFWTGLEANPLLLIWNIQFSRDGFEDLIHRRLRTVGVLISFWKIEKNTKLFFEKMRQFWFLDMLVKMRHFHYETFWLRWDNFVIRHFCYETFLVMRHF